MGLMEAPARFSMADLRCSDERDRRWVERSMLRWFADPWNDSYGMLATIYYYIIY